MKEISRFQMNVAAAMHTLKDQASRCSPQEEEDLLFAKFAVSKQEPVRIAIAVKAYFRTIPISAAHKKELEKYMRIRVRNIVDTLIEEDDPEKIAILEEQGWFGNAELDGFIRTARERGKTQALIYLMMVKNDKYGYQQEPFYI